MRSLAAAETAAIQARTAVARDFLWVTVQNRSTGALTSSGYWNDHGTVTASVVDGRTGSTESRDFYGVGAALSIGSIPLTADITVRSVDITLPHIDSIVQDLVRATDVRNAPMQLYRGYFDPVTFALVAPAKARFVGYIDTAPIVTPKENGEGSITFTCVSTTRELTRTSSEVRSHESQLRRNASDAFYKDTDVVGDWQLFWGQASA